MSDLEHKENEVEPTNASVPPDASDGQSPRSLKWTRFLHRRGISRRKLKGSMVHRYFGDSVLSKELWLFTRESVARGWLIGFYVTIIPFLPAQSIIAVALCVFFRGNVPLGFVLAYLSNPLTAPIHLPACYFVGCLLIGRSPWWMLEAPVGNETILARLAHEGFANGIVPLYLGAVILGALIGVGGYVVIKYFWTPPSTVPRGERTDLEPS